MLHNEGFWDDKLIKGKWASLGLFIDPNDYNKYDIDNMV